MSRFNTEDHQYGEIKKTLKPNEVHEQVISRFLAGLYFGNLSIQGRTDKQTIKCEVLYANHLDFDFVSLESFDITKGSDIFQTFKLIHPSNYIKIKLTNTGTTDTSVHVVPCFV